MADCQYLGDCNAPYEYLERRKGTVTDDKTISSLSFTSIHPVPLLPPTFLSYHFHFLSPFCLHFFSYADSTCTWFILFSNSLLHHAFLRRQLFIQTPNGLSLINRALNSLSRTHKHCVLRSLLCGLNAESVIPWIKYKERWVSISWPATFKVIPPHCSFGSRVIEKMKCCVMWMENRRV